MRRRALLASTALALSPASGCLGDVRRRTAGPIRFGHARTRLHAAVEPFVRRGLGGARTEEPYAAWLFTSPPTDVSVFTAELGSEPQREWDNEVHNENYEAGFLVLAQVRTPRDRARTLLPAPLGCDAGWTGWREARTPLELGPAELSPDELADTDEVVATTLAYFESMEAPWQARVPFLSTEAPSCEAANATLTAGSWTPP
jgi:hypothetical protein